MDKKKAIEYYSKSASKGNANAQFNLGTLSLLFILLILSLVVIFINPL